MQGAMIWGGVLTRLALRQWRASWRPPERWSASLSAMPRPASRWEWKSHSTALSVGNRL